MARVSGGGVAREWVAHGKGLARLRGAGEFGLWVAHVVGAEALAAAGKGTKAAISARRRPVVTRLVKLAAQVGLHRPPSPMRSGSTSRAARMRGSR